MSTTKFSVSAGSFESTQFLKLAAAAGGESAAFQHLIRKNKPEEFAEFLMQMHAREINKLQAWKASIENAKKEQAELEESGIFGVSLA